MTTLRYGIIGSGMMGVEHIENLSHTAGVEVTAIADPDPGSREFAGALVPNALHYTNHEALIADAVCDAVVVASPNFTHVNVLRDLLATDLHVLVEKPLCTTVDDCYTILELAEGRCVAWTLMKRRAQLGGIRVGIFEEAHDRDDVARFLRWLQSTEYKNCTIVVFWDWASLYQDKPEGTRSEEQTLSFKSGLENVNLWYSHDMVISLLNRVKPPERDNEYDESGWPVS